MFITEEKYYDILFDAALRIVEKTSSFANHCVTALYNEDTNEVLAVREIDVEGTYYYTPEGNENV